jgi:hypothetical protein
MVAVKQNKKELRYIPQNLSMSESAPVCQPWSYACSHPMEDILSPKYFLSAGDRLRAGDTIRAVQMSDNNIHSRDNSVLEFADVTITGVNKDSIGMYIVRRVVVGKDGEAQEVETEHVGAPDSGSSSAIEKLSSDVEGACNNIETMRQGHNELVSQVNDIQALLDGSSDKTKDEVKDPGQDEKAIHRWNPGQKRHEAFIGEGDTEQVLYHNTDKQKVLNWIASASGSKE